LIKGLAHICFTVKDLDASVAFYRDLVGLKPAFDFVNEKGERFGVYLAFGGRSFIELFKGSALPAQGQSYQHCCLEVADINAAVAALRAKGIEVTDVTLGGDQTWQAWLADPDGNRIELHQYTPKSWQAPFLGHPRRARGGARKAPERRGRR
jgi:lactoylglutathione lyase/glyoxylase I family protein